MAAQNPLNSKMSTNNPKSSGLANVIAGNTAICTVGKTGKGLTYRGYDIDDLAKHASFEEVAFLLVYGYLPTTQELNDYQQLLVQQRKLPKELTQILQQLPKQSHPMDVLRTAVSALGCLEPETDFTHQTEVANRLLAVLPGILLYWYHFHNCFSECICPERP